jgi:hypothetical protein
MNQQQLEVPVVLLIFKRPDTTQKVFEAIRQAQPTKLLVVSNIPQSHKTEDIQKCQEARAIIEQVDWNCEVLKNYAVTYLGCKERISSGLDWVFQNAEEAIIFEDDCVPHPSFFRYCQELLDYYRHDERVAAITGDNFQLNQQRTHYSYYFSRYTHFWGWATWRRAWQHYDVNMNLWEEVKSAGWLKDLLTDARTISWWSETFEATYVGRKDTWDYQWIFSCWLRNSLCVTPNVNLVTNLGFRADSAHNRDPYDWRANLKTVPMEFPLKHPKFMVRDSQSDSITQKRYYEYISSKNTIKQRLIRKIKRAREILGNYRAGQNYGGIINMLRHMVKG